MAKRLPYTCPGCGAEPAHPTSEMDDIRQYECGTVQTLDSRMTGRLCAVDQRLQSLITLVSALQNAQQGRVHQVIRHDAVYPGTPCDGELVFGNGRMQCTACQTIFDITVSKTH